MATGCARRRRPGKPLQIAVDSAPGTTEATPAPLKFVNERRRVALEKSDGLRPYLNVSLRGTISGSRRSTSALALIATIERTSLEVGKVPTTAARRSCFRLRFRG